MRLGRRFEWLGVYGRGVTHLKSFRRGLVEDAGAVLEPIVSASWYREQNRERLSHLLVGRNLVVHFALVLPYTQLVA